MNYKKNKEMFAIATIVAICARQNRIFTKNEFIYYSSLQESII